MPHAVTQLKVLSQIMVIVSLMFVKMSNGDPSFCFLSNWSSWLIIDLEAMNMHITNSLEKGEEKTGQNKNFDHPKIREEFRTSEQIFKTSLIHYIFLV
jgi:hypothetical protein